MDKILIIQDNPDINEVLKGRLEPEGFFVDTVETGEKGIEKAKIGRYQVILLDYNLPGINGAEVCRILKKEENTKNTPVLFVSAEDEDELRKIIKDAGAQGCVSMPVQKEKFIESIRNAIKSRKD